MVRNPLPKIVSKGCLSKRLTERKTPLEGCFQIPSRGALGAPQGHTEHFCSPGWLCLRAGGTAGKLQGLGVACGLALCVLFILTA